MPKSKKDQTRNPESQTGSSQLLQALFNRLKSGLGKVPGLPEENEPGEKSQVFHDGFTGDTGPVVIPRRHNKGYLLAGLK